MGYDLKELLAIAVLILLVGFVAWFPASGVHALLVAWKCSPFVVWLGTGLAFIFAFIAAWISMNVLAKIFD